MTFSFYGFIQSSIGEVCRHVFAFEEFLHIADLLILARN
jgi:hypothetical protein